MIRVNKIYTMRCGCWCIFNKTNNGKYVGVTYYKGKCLDDANGKLTANDIHTEKDLLTFINQGLYIYSNKFNAKLEFDDWVNK